MATGNSETPLLKTDHVPNQKSNNAATLNERIELENTQHLEAVHTQRTAAREGIPLRRGGRPLRWTTVNFRWPQLILQPQLPSPQYFEINKLALLKEKENKAYRNRGIRNPR